MSKVTSGEALRIPTRLLEVSTFRVFVSTVTSPDTVRAERVPTLVIFVWAAPVTVAAVPDTLPVTLPVSGPEKALAVAVPDTFKLVRVPTLVIFVWAAVVRVAFKAPLTVRLERVPTLVTFGCAAVDKVPVRVVALKVVAVPVPVIVTPVAVVSNFFELS